jgi:hypothetical protein
MFASEFVERTFIRTPVGSVHPDPNTGKNRKSLHLGILVGPREERPARRHHTQDSNRNWQAGRLGSMKKRLDGSVKACLYYK